MATETYKSHTAVWRVPPTPMAASRASAKMSSKFESFRAKYPKGDIILNQTREGNIWMVSLDGVKTKTGTKLLARHFHDVYDDEVLITIYEGQVIDNYGRFDCIENWYVVINL